MAKVLFILGHPGSGKSTAVRDIAEYLREKYEDWSHFGINDYAFLQAKFQTDREPRRFRPADYESANHIDVDHKGFDVIDFTVLDETLQEAELTIQKRVVTATKELPAKELITVEFARNDYKRALGLFKSVLNDAYFLLLEADKDICMERIHTRVSHPIWFDDHYVSEDILNTYYQEGIKQYTPADLKTDFGINDQRVAMINTHGSKQDFLTKVRQFIDLVLE